MVHAHIRLWISGNAPIEGLKAKKDLRKATPKWADGYVEVDLGNFGQINDPVPELLNRVVESPRYIEASMRVYDYNLKYAQISRSPRWVKDGVVYLRNGSFPHVWGKDPLQLILVAEQMEQGKFDGWQPAPVVTEDMIGCAPCGVMVKNYVLGSVTDGVTWVNNLAYAVLGAAIAILAVSAVVR